MTKYSIEPPRRELIAYHSYDIIRETGFVDESPQAHDARAVGPVKLGEPGVIGSSAKLLDEDSNVEVKGLDEHLPLDQLTTSTWTKTGNTVTSGSWVARFSITDSSGTEHVIDHTATENVEDWVFAAGTYDGEEMKLYYAEDEDDYPTVVASNNLSIDVTDFNLEIHVEGEGWVDDTRVYRDALDGDAIGRIFAIARRHQSTDDLADEWPNPGIPYRGKNSRFASALGERIDQVNRDLDALLQAVHIDDAAGEWLDAIGKRVGVARKTGEGDEKYRVRIKTQMAAGRSRGTFDDILTVASDSLDTNPERVELQPNYTQEPATAEMYVRASVVDASPLTESEIVEQVDDALPGGHRIDIVVSTDNPFTLIDDSMTNDPDLGLTSDTTSEGGALTEDL